jgi:hypothetical protein
VDELEVVCGSVATVRQTASRGRVTRTPESTGRFFGFAFEQAVCGAWGGRGCVGVRGLCCRAEELGNRGGRQMGTR